MFLGYLRLFYETVKLESISAEIYKWKLQKFPTFSEHVAPRKIFFAPYHINSPLPLVIRTALLRQYFGKQECWNSQRKSGSPASFVFGALAGHEDLRDAEENYEL